MINEEQFNLLRELAARNQMKSLERSARDIIFAPFQTFCLAYILIVKTALLSLDTGLGKTLISAALVNILKMNVPNTKWLYVCKCDNVDTTAEKLRSAGYSLNVIFSAARSEDILKKFFTKRVLSADVLVVTYEAISHPFICKFLYDHRKNYSGMVIDEAHLISNLTSHTSNLLSVMLDCMEWRIALTATPLRVSPDQTINLMYMLQKDVFGDVNLKAFKNQFKIYDQGKVVGYTGLEQLARMLFPYYVSFTRKELGMEGKYSAHVELCGTDGKYFDVPKSEINSRIKGDPDGKPIEALVLYCCERKLRGLRGLVYINTNANKKLAMRKLSEAGVRAAVLDGHYTGTHQKKRAAHAAYVDGELDVLITNIVTGKDLPSDYICFYEQTFDFVQMKGRGERGLVGADLELAFILSDTRAELSFFYENVYQRGIMLEEVCQKDVQSLHAIAGMIGAKLDKTFLFDGEAI